MGRGNAMTITINGTTGIAGVDGSAATPAVQGANQKFLK